MHTYIIYIYTYVMLFHLPLVHRGRFRASLKSIGLRAPRAEVRVRYAS